MHLFGECSELTHFWITWTQFWSSSGKKMTENGSKCWFLTIISKSVHTIQFKLVVYTCWVSVQNWFAFYPRTWLNFGPLVAKKSQWKCVKILVSDHYQKKYSSNPIQIWCVHLLGECSELIRFWATLAKFCPPLAQKIMKLGENGCFPPPLGKLSTQPNWFLVCTPIWRVFRNDSIFCCIGLI